MKNNWPAEHEAALIEYIAAGSFQEIATMINQRFGTNYSRNAVLGKANRMKLLAGHARERDGRPAKKRDIRPRAKPSVAPPLAPAEPSEPRHVGLLELIRHDCRFPFGDGPFTFCGCPVWQDKPYCADHVQITKGERA